jgi:hypothetical protein
MRQRGIEVEVVLLDVFAVIAFAAPSIAHSSATGPGSSFIVNDIPAISFSGMGGRPVERKLAAILSADVEGA